MSAVKASFQTIMDAAEALIQEKGCRQTTLQDIIARTGLSKGAIYHYVSSKDELFGLVLKSRVEQINARFAEVVASPNTSGLGSPLQLIAEGMVRSANAQDVTNKIFIYLLSQMDNEKVEAIVQDMYRFTLQTCAGWIDVGKMHGVIPKEVDGAQVAHMLVMFTYGMRVQNTILREQGSMTVQDLIAFMTKALG
ncbi:TetR/AcrR family transcriptional regulator [Paenibacillus lycopersici]|uniref:TetR/AcrR family transcriptional regulator n=1 Tax=Paenibacillus lycopersici TaxID=2704462 RepID=A0A6C0FSA0_9BACL|nr:TetR/AcrR family transcriptional regulator [Paenibacillus lycopersici]QHT58952.1 TetR/AcrR family transcriptional regulator [Paenibacillus lycopersici]